VSSPPAGGTGVDATFPVPPSNGLAAGGSSGYLHFHVANAQSGGVPRSAASM
jgi:hypothetical protein